MLLPIVLCHRGHECMHDFLQKEANVKYYDTSKSRKLHETYEWKNFRIKFDTSELLSDEELSCTHVGQNFKSKYNNITVTCEQADIITPEKIEAVKKTLDNVRMYLEKLLYVIPLEGEFTGNSSSIVVSDADFLMRVHIISCRRCQIVAGAKYLDVEPKFNRPVIGLCYLNARMIPQEAADYDSEDSQFFMTILHETFHSLGFSYEYFSLYMHPHENPTPYNNPVCNLTTYGIDFKILVTPMAHRFAVNHYGVEEFEGDNGKKCPSGIKLENYGGSNSAASHLKGSTFMSDLMVGVPIAGDLAFNRLTDATLAVLADTGNYKINWTMAQPLVWGNPESINGSYLKDFALGPPQLVYPEHYFYDDLAKIDNSLFNFRALGVNLDEYFINNEVDSYCNGPYRDSFDFCTNPNYYNPKHKNSLNASPFHDYLLFKTPKKNCPKGEAAMHGNYMQCVKYTCNDYTSVTFTLPQHGDITCDKDSIGKEYQINSEGSENAKVWCPDPEAFCRTTKLHDMHFIKNPFIKNVRQLDDSEQDDSDVKYTAVPGIVVVKPSDNPENNPSNETEINPGNETHNNPGNETQNNPGNETQNNPGNPTRSQDPGSGQDESETEKEKAKKRAIYIAVGVVCGVVVCASIAAGVIFYNKFNQKTPEAPPQSDDVDEILV